MADKFEYKPFSFRTYQESNSAKVYKNNATAAEKAVKNYGDFVYDKQGTLDNVLNNYLNRDKFSYDLNGDALYQQYKDKYIQQGKLAMQDTMGQAAAMTGGYGNSYASTAGNQAYQASLQNLNDVVPELYQLAQDRYNQEGQDMLNQYSLLSDDRATKYGMYNDKYSRLVTDRDYYANAYNNERVYDRSLYESDRTHAYDKYSNDKSYSYNEHRNAIADKQWEADFNEAVRQFNETMAENKRQFDESMAKASSGGGGGGGGSSKPALTAEEWANVVERCENYMMDGNTEALEKYIRGLRELDYLNEAQEKYLQGIEDEIEDEESGFVGGNGGHYAEGMTR